MLIRKVLIKKVLQLFGGKRRFASSVSVTIAFSFSRRRSFVIHVETCAERGIYNALLEGGERKMGWAYDGIDKGRKVGEQPSCGYGNCNRTRAVRYFCLNPFGFKLNNAVNG